MTQEDLNKQVEAFRSNSIPGGTFDFTIIQDLEDNGTLRQYVYPVFIKLDYAKAKKILNHYGSNLTFQVDSTSGSRGFSSSGTFPAGNQGGSLTVRVPGSIDLNDPDSLYEFRKAIWVKHMEVAMLNCLVDVFADPYSLSGKAYFEDNVARYAAERASRKLSSRNFLGWDIDAWSIKEAAATRRTSNYRIIELADRTQKLWDEKLCFDLKNNPIGAHNSFLLGPSNQPNPEIIYLEIWESSRAEKFRKMLDDFFEGCRSQPVTLTSRSVITQLTQSGKEIKENLNLLDLLYASASHAPNILVGRSLGSIGVFSARFRPANETTTYTIIGLNRDFPKQSRGKNIVYPDLWAFIHELLHGITPVFINEYGAYRDQGWERQLDPDFYVEKFYDSAMSVWLKTLPDIDLERRLSE